MPNLTRPSFFIRSGKVKLPEWVDVVKTSTTKELAPYDPDWYYTRCASLARHVYVRSPVGVSTVCKIYGGEMTILQEGSSTFVN
jgi:small subunit ribosomal protein S19e